MHTFRNGIIAWRCPEETEEVSNDLENVTRWHFAAVCFSFLCSFVLNFLVCFVAQSLRLVSLRDPHDAISQTCIDICGLDCLMHKFVKL